MDIIDQSPLNSRSSQSAYSPVPLSFAQQRLWFLAQLAPNNPFYNITAAFRIFGLLDLSALENTFQIIVQRHEPLRTTFVAIEGTPQQKISPHLDLSIPFIDLSHLLDKETQAKNICHQESKKPFNLTQGPLLRVMVIKLQETEFIMLINIHHIIADGWSMGILTAEIGMIYTSLVNNQPVKLPPLPLQYADFATAQRQWLQDGENTTYSKQLSYWVKRLEAIEPLNLPTDKLRPPIPSYQGKSQKIQLSKDLSDRLYHLRQLGGTTLFMTLLAAFYILLFYYTQQRQITIGSPIANRNQSDIEGLIGFFVNTLVMDINLEGNPSYRELLQQVKEMAIAAYSHQDLPFEKLVEAINTERKLEQNPLFQVVFALQNAPQKALELPNLTLQPMQLEIQTTRFDLEFHLWEPETGEGLWVDSTQGISGLVVYNSDLFEDHTITFMIEHFQNILEQVVSDPEKKLSQIEILSPSQKNQILFEWNNTQQDYPTDLCVHQLFEKQAESTPEAIALVFSDQQITYKELNKRSNQLAHYLRKQGVKPETKIALLMEASPEMIIAILGVLKAGGAYIPLDINYPTSRLNYILSDAKVDITLTKKDIELSHNICHFEGSEESHQLESIENLTPNVTAKNLAYVIYTSGSTGNPKGVEITHKALLNLIYWHQKTFEVTAADKTTQVANFGFDACVWEIWPYLTIGATIFFPDYETLLNPEKLLSWLALKEITISFFPTMIAEKFFEVNLTSNLPSNLALRILLTGGDKLNKYPSQALPFKVVNNYGPTENTVVTTSTEITQKKGLLPPIGRPIANTQVYVLNEFLQPLPIGIPGELYISGDGLARGYLNSPDLTKEKFINHPFLPNQKIYKTGDKVRYRLDGNIEFLGRFDEQVKIRGYRLELGEIEALLNQHPSIEKCLVTTSENSLKEKSLVAYLQINSAPTQSLSLQQEQIFQWQTLYNDIYHQQETLSDPTFNITGWNSSYTNQPMAEEQMRSWVNNQVKEILALQPKRVLEIGCGTGLLLFKIAPHTQKYLGVDFSSQSIRYIQSVLAKQPLPQVALLNQAANNFHGIDSQGFDTVVINSVIQYFPSVEYLLLVIEGAIASTAPGGVIFLGDIRCLSLLKAYHAAVQFAQAEKDLTASELHNRIQTEVFQETELLIDPNFFRALKQHFPRISHVEFHLLQGDYDNELTQFRYNVTLHVEKDFVCLDGYQSLDWVEENLTLENLHQLLKETQPQILSLTNILNRRTREAIAILKWLNSGNDGTLADFTPPPAYGINPQEFYTLAEELNYDIDICFSPVAGYYHVIFKQTNVATKITEPLQDWSAYTNNPLQVTTARFLVPQLQSYLADKLPDYAIPSAFVVLQSLPLNPNGKLDKLALSKIKAIAQQTTYQEPTTEIQQTLVKIFAEVLSLKRVSINDNFFSLGGHSLLATQLISRLRDSFKIELPLRSVFECPTPGEFASYIETLKQSNTTVTAPPIIPVSRDARRRKLSSL